MTTKTTAILTGLLLLGLACTNTQGDNSQGGQDPRQDLTCKAGDFDFDGDGVRDFTLECWPNGKRKKRTEYDNNTGVTKSETTYYESNGYQKTETTYLADGLTKNYEYTYYENNGNEKTRTKYEADGITKDYENTYYESHGTRKVRIIYEADGMTLKSGYPKCYNTNGYTAETCTLAKHGIQ